MRRWRTWGLYALLLALALAAGLAAGRKPGDSSLHSVENPGPEGLKVLKTWLEESGVQVQVLREPLTTLPKGVRTVILPAPEGKSYQPAELDALLAFADAGGTLIVFAPRSGQGELRRRLRIVSGAVAPISAEVGFDDLGGATLETRFPGGLVAGTRKLRVKAELLLRVDAEGAVPVARPEGLWFERRGEGELWVGSGADLATNARLELLDNLVFWQNVAARGPVAFDEGHHLAAEASLWPTNLLATLLQLSFVALTFVLARGARLGPPRPTGAVRHRNALEYVKAMASLTENAQVEGELTEQLRHDFRLTLQERLGVAASLPLHEAAREVARHTGISAAEVVALLGLHDFLPLARAIATLEGRLEGRRSSDG